VFFGASGIALTQTLLNAVAKDMGLFEESNERSEVEIENQLVLTFIRRGSAVTWR